MPLPDEVLDFLAQKYDRACIDCTRFPFVTWASIEAEKLGWKI